jgi:hypothetical protein
MAERMRRIEWTWVKAHNGYVLNECADMLATKGVNNETPFSNVQYIHPINEDVDFQTYEFHEGEESSVGSNRKGDDGPAETSVMKDGDNLPQYLSSSSSPDPTPWPYAPASAQVSAPMTDVPSDDKSDGPSDIPVSDSLPQAANTDDEGHVEGGTVRFNSIPISPRHDGVRPDRWSLAWERLNGILMRTDSPLLPVSPKDFRETVDTDVYMADQIG